MEVFDNAQSYHTPLSFQEQSLTTMSLQLKTFKTISMSSLGTLKYSTTAFLRNKSLQNTAKVFYIHILEYSTMPKNYALSCRFSSCFPRLHPKLSSMALTDYTKGEGRPRITAVEDRPIEIIRFDLGFVGLVFCVAAFEDVSCGVWL